MLIGRFLGTSAGEGTPAPYCRCDNCNEARAKGIPFARTRSCFRLSDKIMIDLGADAVYQARMFGDLADVEHVLITHTHEDHLNVHMLMEAFWSRATRRRMHYWFTEDAFNIVDKWRNSSWILKGMVPQYEEEGIVEFHKLTYGVPQTIDEVTVIPFKGRHRGNVGESSAMYLVILPDGRKLFYGLDSGPYYPETIEALKEHTVDIYISEATGGTRLPIDGGVNRQHMTLTDVRELTDKLLEQGTLTPQSRLYLTHINHSTSHSQMEEGIKKMKFPVHTETAYDGMTVL